MRSYKLSITLRAPIMTRSTAIGAYGVDSPVARDADGLPFIPGSHVQGKLREALGDLASVADDPEEADDEIAKWFGAEGMDGGEHRKRVIVTDLTFDRDRDVNPPDLQAAARKPNAPSRTRTAIDDASGAALDHAVQTLETPFPAGAEVTFSGLVRILANDRTADDVRDWLVPGLCWISQIGGGRSVGFGRVVEVQLAHEPERRRPQTVPYYAEGIDVPSRWRVVLNFKEPFCIARPTPERNLFASSDIIPGGALKGALARLMLTSSVIEDRRHACDLVEDADLRHLARHFSALRFTHAFPAKASVSGGPNHALIDDGGQPRPPKATRPSIAPLSLVQTDGGQLFDVARQDGPGRIIEKLPAFRGDWKGEGTLSRYFPWPEPERELRVRTAIDGDYLSAAPDKLFAYELIRPGGFVWLGELDLAGIENHGERSSVVDELVELVAGGLPGLGKTLATAELLLEPIEDERPAADPRRLQDGKATLTLQTPALLCRLDDLRGDGEALHRAYAAAFETLSGGAMKLRHFFADQRLAGGPHFRHRFMRTGYQPWVLSEPGSVFLLDVVPGEREAAQAWLTSIELHGLDIPTHLLPDDESEELFLRLPFLRQNGYGEIAIDLDRSHPGLDPGRHFEPVGASA